MCVQIPSYVLGGYQRSCGRPMEPAQDCVRDPLRDGCPGADVLRKSSVIGGRKGLSSPQRPAAPRQAQRPLGCDMQGLGRESVETPEYPFFREQRKADLGVGRTRYCPKFLRRHNENVVAFVFKTSPSLRQGPDHPVRLGQPGVGDDGDPHAAESRGLALSSG